MTFPGIGNTCIGMPPLETCDVLIVGGGPAGSTCAWALRRAGLDVVVLDAQSFPRDKVCAGWITPAVIQALELDIGAYSQGREFQPITGFRTGIIGGAEVATRYDATVSYGIRRCQFDEYLLRRSGARLVLGEPLQSMERNGAHWIVNGHLKTPMLVGAGGHFCPVARRLGAKLGSGEPIVAAKEIEFLLTPEQAELCRARGDTPELFFCEDLKGYGWCFRKDNYLNIGLGREDSHRLSDHLAAFRDFLVARGKVPDDVPRAFHGHAYLLYGRGGRPLLEDGVLLVGDAVGLAYPQSGEGIRPAVESALLAARVIAKTQGDYRRPQLEPYRAALTEHFGPQRQATGALLPDSWRSLLGKKLLANSWFTRHVVLDRWFLHRQVPTLAPLR